MVATYLPRVETVVSFQQLEDEAHTTAAAAVADKLRAQQSQAAQQPGPQSPVSNCLGAMLPLYSYAVRAAPKATVPRVASTTSLALVPDMDNTVSGLYGDFGSDDDSSPLAGSSCGDLKSLGTKVRASPERAPGSPTPQVVPVMELGVLPQDSLLDTVLLALWEDCAEQGLFRYDVTACSTKVLPGVYGFVAQLNEGRATQKRPTEFRIDQVVQPFDPSKFNFTKAFMREVLLQFEPAAGAASALKESSPSGSNPSLVLINVSPIEYGHVLLVPRVNDCLPQLVDPSTMHMALSLALEANNPYFRVGYNSLGAYATINHLHFQAYYLAAPFACERAPTEPLTSPLKRKRGSVQISRLVDFPVNGFMIEVGSCLAEMASVVGQACLNMQAANIPHNLLICDSGSRVFLWPQCYAERQAAGVVPQEILDTGVNPAVFEIAGHMVLKRAADYEAMTQELAWAMLEQVSLPEERFLEVARICFG